MSNSTEHSKLLSHPEIDFLGSIQFPASKRFFPSELKTEKPVIGVFVDATLDEIISKLEAFHLKGVQLHGSESASFCSQLPSNLIKIKAIAIETADDFKYLAAYEGLIDYFLFDTKTSLHGGSGVKFDWNLLSNYTGSIPFLLSGGIGPNDLGQIQGITHAQFAGVDINSCFELEPGKKDTVLVETFIQELQ